MESGMGWSAAHGHVRLRDGRARGRDRQNAPFLGAARRDYDAVMGGARRTTWGLLALAAACHPPAPHAQPRQQAVIPPAASASAVLRADASIATVALPEHMRAIDLAGVKITLFAADADGVTMAPDRRTVAVVRRKAIELRVGDGPPVSLGVHAATRVEISASSRYLVASDEQHLLHVFAIPSGTRLLDVPKVRSWALEGETLLTRSDCDLSVVELAHPARTRPVGRWCDPIVRSRPREGTALVGEPSKLSPMLFRGYRTLEMLDLASGRKRPLVTVADDDSFVLEPVVSPTLSRLCFRAEDWSFHCIDTASGRAIAFPQANVQRAATLDDAGRRVVFATRAKLGAPLEVWVGDATTGRAVRMFTTEHEWWDFLPGGRRLVFHGGDARFAVADLEGGWEAELGDAHQEYEGLWVVPGDPTRFFIGRERDASRDIYLVELGR